MDFSKPIPFVQARWYTKTDDREVRKIVLLA